MSRSRKKTPYVSMTCHGDNAGAQKQWKKECNRRLRTTDCDISNGSSYKRISGDEWCSPKDGKQLWEDPKSYRK